MSEIPSAQEPIFQRLDLYPRFDYSLREYARRWAWEWVQRLLLRPSPHRAYAWRRFWFRRFGAQVHSTCLIDAGARVLHPWLLSAGAHTWIGDCTIWNPGPVTIGRQTVISQGAHLCAGTHDYTQPAFPLQRLPIRVGHGVWVAAEAFIGPDCDIGDNSVVAGRAVVTGRVEPGTVVAGNPAQVIKRRPMAPESGVRGGRRQESGVSEPASGVSC